MKKILFLIIIASFLTQCATSGKKDSTNTKTTTNNENFRKKAPGAAPARPINLGEYTTFDLENGLKVIVVENHKLPRVSYQISLNNDPIVEGDQAGYVSVTGDLIARGTTTRTKAKLDEEIDFIGASLNTSGYGIFASSLKKHSSKLLELMTDVLYNPSFSKEEFDKIIQQTISGLAAAKTDPNAIASNVGNVVMYGKDHPYGEVQTEKTVKAIKLDKCKNYYETYFKPNNAYLVIVGDINPDEARMQANKYFGNWKRGDIPSFKYKTPTAPKETKVVFANKDGAVQSVINVLYPVSLKPGAPDILAVNIMNNILGGGIFSGRLMQNLREKKAYTYGARSSLSSDKLVGSFKAFASVRNAVTDSAVQEFIYEMDKIAKEPVSESELSLAKNSMAGDFARSLESPQTIANFALNTFRYNLPKDYYNTYLSRLEKVTIADVTNAAKKYITPKNAYILVVGNKDKVADNLLRFDGDGKIDYYDAYGEVLNMDNISIPSGVTAQTVIEDYIDAIGGLNKIKNIKSLITTGSMSLMGQQVSVTKKQHLAGYLLTKMDIPGMGTVMEQKVNPTEAVVTQMGQSRTFKAGDSEYEGLKEEVNIFDQIDYLGNSKFKTELKGIENIDGANCYKIEVTMPNGKSNTQFYDMKTNLLKRVVQTLGEGQNTMTTSTDFGSYKAVNGITMPHEIKISGQMPTTMSLTVSGYEFNTLSEKDF